MDSESIAQSASASWAIDSEPIRARGLIVKYTILKVKSDYRSKFSDFNNWKEEAWKNEGFKGIRTCTAFSLSFWVAGVLWKVDGYGTW